MKPNIIFISFDACRPDHLGYMGYSKDTSPFLDSLAKKGAYFTRAFATGPGSPHSFVAILTSTYPFDYGGFARIKPPRVLLSEVLKQNGYTTIGIHSAAYMSGFFGYDRGWDTFKYLSHFKGGDIMQGVKPGTWQTRVVKKFDALRRYMRDHLPWARWVATLIEKVAFGWRKVWRDLTNYRFPFYTADEVNEEVCTLLPRAPEKPLFLWVHYMDTHGPYGLFWQKSSQFMKRLKFHLSDFVGYFLGKIAFVNKWFLPLHMELYDASIRYVDEHIEKLFQHLTSVGILDDESIVVICSDHGEEFLERGWVGHSDSLWNINLNVPLIVYGNRHVSPAVVERPVSLLDISPTILDLAQLPAEPAFKGKSVFDEAERPIVAQVPDTDTDLSNQTFLGAAIISEGWKLIHMVDKKMLFSLEHDFGEQNNVYETEPTIVARLEPMLAPYERILPHQ